MRVRGRRVVWLLASALPLLAEEHQSSSTSTVSQQQHHLPQQTDETSQASSPRDNDNSPLQALVSGLGAGDDQEEEAENDYIPVQTVEAIHYDSFRLPSLDGSAASSKKRNKKNASTTTVSSESLKETEQHENHIQKDEESLEDLEVVDKDDGGATGGDTSMGRSKEEESSSDTSSGESNKDKSDDNADNPDLSSSPGEEKGVKERPSTTENAGEEDSTSPNLDENASHFVKVEEANNTTTTLPTSDKNQTIPEKDESSDESIQQEASSSPSKDLEDDEDEEEEDIAKRVAVDYASKSAGALILEKAKSFKGTSNLLNSDKDKYAIAPCEDKKFVVIGLSEDILVKTIVLANHERFTSWTKEFQVLGSQTMGTWADLGTYEAKPGNGEQAFDLREPAWTRYLKIKFLTHHGAEYYCTVSQIKVHGSTMLQGFHEQWEEENESDNDNSDDSIGEETTTENKREESGDAEESQLALVSVETPVASASVLESFKESAELTHRLAGHGNETELFNTLFDLIPQTLNGLPTTAGTRSSRNEPKSQIASMMGTAVSSLWRNSLSSTDDAVKTMVASSISEKEEAIQTPKMSDILDKITHRGRQTKAVHPSTASDPRPTHIDGISSDSAPPVATETTSNTPEQEAAANINEVDVSLEDNQDDDRAVSPQTDGQTDKKGATVDSSSVDRPTPMAETLSQADQYVVDDALLQLLARLPSSDCLEQLDFSVFKEKTVAARKGPTSNGEKHHPASAMEPIFKKLTDEIKTLQTNLLVHDQFQKLSSSCYQRILLDLVVEVETLRNDHEARISNLEQGFFARLLRTIVQLLTWAVVAVTFMAQVVGFVFIVLSKVSSFLARVAISLWPALKKAILSTSTGSKVFSHAEPVFEFFDRLHSETATYDFGQLDGKNDQKIWLPILPLLLILGFCRLLMLFRASNTTFRLSRSPSSLRPSRHKTQKSDSYVVGTTVNRRHRSQSVPEERHAYEKYRSRDLSSPESQKRLLTVSESLPSLQANNKKSSESSPGRKKEITNIPNTTSTSGPLRETMSEKMPTPLDGESPSSQPNSNTDESKMHGDSLNSGEVTAKPAGSSLLSPEEPEGDQRKMDAERSPTPPLQDE